MKVGYIRQNEYNQANALGRLKSAARFSLCFFPPVICDVINMKQTDQIIDDFVKKYNRRGQNILRFEDITWVDSILTKLPTKYPPSFLSLVRRYVFDPFDIEEITLFANRGDNSGEDLAIEIFKDRYIFTTTVSNGFIQFSRPSDGSYDPICFDIRKRNKSGEYPVVQLDHEEILQFEKVKVVKRISESFIDMVRKNI